MGFFGTLFGGEAEQEAADKNRALTTQYGTDAQNYLKTGYDTGTTAINQGVGAYSPLATLGQKYGGATGLYLNALGLNGGAGQPGGLVSLHQQSRLYRRGQCRARHHQPPQGFPKAWMRAAMPFQDAQTFRQNPAKHAIQ